MKEKTEAKRKRILSQSIIHLHGPESVNFEANELTVLCVVRNGGYYMESFLEHYFSLGVKQIVFLDNHSTDETVSIAQNYRNVTVLQTELPFREYEYLMRQYLVSRFGEDRWTLCVDIDELFDFPYSHRISPGPFLDYLDKNSYTAVVAYMLDMFSDYPMQKRARGINESLKALYPFYDLSGIVKTSYAANFCPHNTISNSEIKHYTGGIRKIIFDFGHFYLTKHPLVRFEKGMNIWPHSAHKIENARIADITGVLLHFKLIDYFPEIVSRAVRERSYGKASTEYEKYHAVIKKHPEFSMKQETSRELKDTNELIDNEFLAVSRQYVDWMQFQT